MLSGFRLSDCNGWKEIRTCLTLSYILDLRVEIRVSDKCLDSKANKF